MEINLEQKYSRYLTYLINLNGTLFIGNLIAWNVRAICLKRFMGLKMSVTPKNKEFHRPRNTDSYKCAGAFHMLGFH